MDGPRDQLLRFLNFERFYTLLRFLTVDSKQSREGHGPIKKSRQAQGCAREAQGRLKKSREAQGRLKKSRSPGSRGRSPGSTRGGSEGERRQQNISAEKSGPQIGIVAIASLLRTVRSFIYRGRLQWPCPWPWRNKDCIRGLTEGLICQKTHLRQAFVMQHIKCHIRGFGLAIFSVMSCGTFCNPCDVPFSLLVL